MLKDGSGASQSCVWFPLSSDFSCTQKFEVNRHGGDEIPKNPKPTAFKEKLAMTGFALRKGLLSAAERLQLFEKQNLTSHPQALQFSL